jgi:hypothetical protein
MRQARDRTSVNQPNWTVSSSPPLRRVRKNRRRFNHRCRHVGVRKCPYKLRPMRLIGHLINAGRFEQLGKFPVTPALPLHSHHLLIRFPDHPILRTTPFAPATRSSSLVSRPVGIFVFLRKNFVTCFPSGFEAGDCRPILGVVLDDLERGDEITACGTQDSRFERTLGLVAEKLSLARTQLHPVATKAQRQAIRILGKVSVRRAAEGPPRVRALGTVGPTQLTVPENAA